MTPPQMFPVNFANFLKKVIWRIYANGCFCNFKKKSKTKISQQSKALSYLKYFHSRPGDVFIVKNDDYNVLWLTSAGRVVVLLLSYSIWREWKGTRMWLARKCKLRLITICYKIKPCSFEVAKELNISFAKTTLVRKVFPNQTSHWH